MKGNIMKKNHTIIGSVSFVVLCFLFFVAITRLPNQLMEVTPETTPGRADLTTFDFHQTLARIPHTSFLYYKDALYSPEDFKEGSITQEPVILAGMKARFNPGEYGTYHLVLDLPDHMTYGISSHSAMYSQRLFINGDEQTPIGTPGKTEETTTPATKQYTYYFEPEEGQAEIIIQFANFNHADYGGIVPLMLGSQDNIQARNAMAQQRIHIRVGFELAAYLFFLGLYLIFRNRPIFLWFALTCMAIGVRTLMVEEKAVMILLPQLSWRASITTEYLALVLLGVAFIRYISHMFTGAVNNRVTWGYLGLCGFYAGIILFTPPLVFTRYILWFQVLSALMGLYLAAALAHNAWRKKDNRQPEHILVLSGALVFILLSILDIQVHRSSGYALGMGLSGSAMIILIFTNMLALALQFSRTETQLDDARRIEAEMHEKNRLLDQMSRLKSDFLANISHEMRTPLTIMAGYADLTAMQLKHHATDEKTLDGLDTIKREAIRLGDLVEQIKAVSLEKEWQHKLSVVEARELLQQAVDFCQPICAKKKNKLKITLESENIRLQVHPESILQTLINLLINANRHTKEGNITLRAEGCQAGLQHHLAQVTIADDGDGIAPELLPKVFDRGFSGDESSGFGLAISKELIENHGGEIWIESETGKGTNVIFTLPCWKGDHTHDESQHTSH